MTLQATTKEIQKLVGALPDGIYGPETAGKVLAFLQQTIRIDIITPDVPAETGLEFDPRTAKNLATLQPGAQRKFEPFIRRAIGIAAAMGVELKVISGLRDKAAQEAAKASGASKAGYGYSWHNYGMAVDFGCFKGGRYLDNADPRTASQVYAAIGAVAPSYGIEWGGSWRSFKDYPHFQIDTGTSTPTASHRSQLNQGTWHLA